MLENNLNSPEIVTYHHAIESEQSSVLATIYQEKNISIWRRELSIAVQRNLEVLMKSGREYRAAMTVSPQNAEAAINELLGCGNQHHALSKDIAELVDMFCVLFDLKQTGLRLTTLDHAMCPRFHVDHVPCRLVTTYQGVATQWLPHHAVDRSKLGRGNQGLPDEQSGIYLNESDICQLTTGDVALLKGELWEGNENAGLVHRSPTVTEGEQRLLLTLDFIHQG